MGSHWLSVPELEAMLGADAARRLTDEAGGMTVYICKRPGGNKQLERAIGKKAIAVLRERFGGENVGLPSATRRRATFKSKIIPLLEAGLSLNIIAQTLGCSWRLVAKVRQDTGLGKAKEDKGAGV